MVGDVLQGTFVQAYISEDGVKQDTEGLNKIVVINDMTDESKTLTQMPEGYRSFALDVNGAGTYTIFTDSDAVAKGGGRFFNKCTDDFRSDEDVRTAKDIKETFDRLGIPQAERKSLAGVGAQYDSELVYHNVKDEVAEQGVIYTDMESALHGEYADMVKEYFMKLVTPRDHKFAALHGAVWSGGSFVYVPKGVHLSIPLQSYFRLNAKGAGQFEHTLIIVDEGASLHFIEGCSAPKYNVANLHAGCVELFVKKNAKLRYSTIENWSKNMYNLNTKRAIVEEGGTVEWVSGSFGSHVGYLYPMSILKGKGAKMEFTGVTFAGNGQNLDTGAKVVHAAPDTSSFMNTRSISKSGGISTFRSSVVINKNAKNSKSAVSCQSLMLDSISRSDTIPAMDIRTKDAAVGHEAKIGSISDDAVFYLMSRGMSEEDAKALIVSGFADNVSKELPLEYAVEMNNLIRLEMKGSIG